MAFHSSTDQTEQDLVRLKVMLGRFRPWLLIALFLAMATLAVYWQVRNCEFINFDDDLYVTRNHHVRSGLTLDGAGWALTATRAKNWHPLTWLSHMLDVELYGMDPGGHHATNLIFHIINTLLLFHVLRRMTGDLWQCGLVASLFALHPLHAESVAWVSERKDLICTFFWFLTLWAYTRYVEEPTFGRYVSVVVPFVLGLLAKPMLVTLPFVLLLLDYWPFKRLRFNPKINSPVPQPMNRSPSQPLHLIREKIPLFCLSAASSIATVLVQKSGGALGSIETYSIGTRVANALVSYVKYMGMMIWPFDLAILYPHHGLPQWWQVAGALTLLAVITLLSMRFARSYAWFAVGWLWYIGTLVPVIGIVQVGVQSMADRYTYVPLVGLFIIIAWGIPEVLGRWRYSLVGFVVIVGASLFLLGALTVQQVHHWKNSVSLFEHCIDVTARNQGAHNNLANALSAEGRDGEAIRHYLEALRINPDYALAHNNLGLALARGGRIAEASRHYAKALSLDNDFEEAHNNLGAILVRQGRTVEALSHYSEAIRINPSYWEAYVNMAMVLETKGDIDGAIQHCLKALRINPGNERLHNNLGVLFARKGMNKEATAHFKEALRISPGYADAEKNLKKALGMQKENGKDEPGKNNRVQ